MSEAELRMHLREQLGFLRRSAAAYDDGHHSEAKRLATVIRTLVHDTGTSTSLLGQMGIKNALQFIDTVPVHEPPEFVEEGLMSITVNFGLVPVGGGHPRPRGVRRSDRGGTVRPHPSTTGGSGPS